MATIRNLLKQPLVLPVSGMPPFTLSAHGDPSGADMIDVEDDIVAKVEVRKAITTNKIAQLSDDEVIAVARRRVESREDAEREASAAIDDSLVIKKDESIIGKHCIGPGSRPTLQCGAPVLQSAAVREGDEPPLCAAHQNLSGQYFQTEVMPDEDGPVDPGSVMKVWKKAVVSDPVISTT